MTRIALLATGGTIACTKDSAGALVPTLTAADLLDSLSEPVNCEVIPYDFRQLDSSALTMADYDDLRAEVCRILEDESIDGIVITHGTDSMEETAMVLDCVYSDPRPIILTGAQFGADHPQSDGPANLLGALTVANAPSARDMGVLIVFGDDVVMAYGARKAHTVELSPFEGIADPDAARVSTLPIAPLKDVRVDIISCYPGADSTALDAAIAAGASGIVMEAMGSGNMGPAQAEGVVRTLHKGIPVVLCTRVFRGPVSFTYGGAGGGNTLAQYGLLPGGELPASQARVLLASCIAAAVDPAQVFTGSSLPDH